MWPANYCPCPPQPSSGGFVANEFPQLTTDFSSGCEPVVLTAGGWGGCSSPILTGEVTVPWPAPCPPMPCPPGPPPCPQPDLTAQLVAALIATMQGGSKGQCGCGGMQQQLAQMQAQLACIQQQQAAKGYASGYAGSMSGGSACPAPGYAPPAAAPPGWVP